MIRAHVAVVRSTKIAVEDSQKSVNTGFSNTPETSEYNLDTFLDNF